MEKKVMVGLGTFTPPPLCKMCSYSTYRIRRTFQPYGWCSHNCVYCYVPYGYRYKYYHSKGQIIAVDLAQLQRDYLKLKPHTMIEAASSCDVADMKFEKKYRITKKALEEIFSLRTDIQFTFLTKSNVIAEYIDILPRLSVVQITIESKRTHTSSPNAATYDQRVGTVKLLSDAGIAVGVRIDPLIPKWIKNEEIMEIIETTVTNGCKHITCSTLKLYTQQFTPIEKAFNINIRNSYYYNVRARQYYLRDDIRKAIELSILDKCNNLGITFATCMEELVPDTGNCDPFHLITPLLKQKVSEQ